MDRTDHVYTVWTVTPVKDHYRLRINSIGGHSGNTSIIELGKQRMRLLLDFYNVGEESDLENQTFESSEDNGAAALYGFLFRIMMFD